MGADSGGWRLFKAFKQAVVGVYAVNEDKYKIMQTRTTTNSPTIAGKDSSTPGSNAASKHFWEFKQHITRS